MVKWSEKISSLLQLDLKRFQDAARTFFQSTETSDDIRLNTFAVDERVETQDEKALLERRKKSLDAIIVVAFLLSAAGVILAILQCGFLKPKPDGQTEAPNPGEIPVTPPTQDTPLYASLTAIMLFSTGSVIATLVMRLAISVRGPLNRQRKLDALADQAYKIMFKRLVRILLVALVFLICGFGHQMRYIDPSVTYTLSFQKPV